MGIKNKGSLTLYRKNVIHLNRLERRTDGKHLFEVLTQWGKFKDSVPKFVKWDPLRIIARNPEHCVEGAIARLDSKVGTQHYEGIDDRIEDRLGAFAFVDCLIGACAESSHISEREHGPDDLAIALRVRGYPNNKPLVPVTKIDPGFYFTVDDVAAVLF
jgi:hypothetical protein